MVLRRVACPALLGIILFVAPAPADDLATKDGKIYKDYKVQKTDSDGITLQYTETVTIPFDNLPDDIQKKYGHDPNALSAEQAAEKARIDAENKEAAQIEAGLDEQDRQIEPDLTRIKSQATAEYAAAPKVNLSGQVFVAAQGGEAVDFSGVHVRLVPMELIDRWLPQNQSRVATEERLLKSRIARAQKDEDQALKERAAAVGTDKFSTALDRESQAHDILNALLIRQDYFAGGEYYADALAPWTVADVTTDLTGKFTLPAPPKGDFILTASVKSEKGATTKKYFWFIKVHPADTTGANTFILLDSENQSSSGSEDSVLKTEVSGADNSGSTSGG